MSAQLMLTQGIANHTESILTNLTNLIELIRGAPQAASPTALDPNINNYVQRKLESLSSEVGNIRADLRAIKVRSDCDRQSAQMKLIGETNLVDLLDLEDADNFVENTLTTEKNNELARRYNNNLRNIYDFIAPLRNARGNVVHGFPATVGKLLNLGYTPKHSYVMRSGSNTSARAQHS